MRRRKESGGASGEKVRSFEREDGESKVVRVRSKKKGRRGAKGVWSCGCSM